MTFWESTVCCWLLLFLHCMWGDFIHDFNWGLLIIMSTLWVGIVWQSTTRGQYLSNLLFSTSPEIHFYNSLAAVDEIKGLYPSFLHDINISSSLNDHHPSLPHVLDQGDFKRGHRWSTTIRFASLSIMDKTWGRKEDIRHFLCQKSLIWFFIVDCSSIN